MTATFIPPFTAQPLRASLRASGALRTRTTVITLLTVVKGIIGMCLGHGKEGGRASKESREYIQEMVVVLEAEARSILCT